MITATERRPARRTRRTRRSRAFMDRVYVLMEVDPDLAFIDAVKRAVLTAGADDERDREATRERRRIDHQIATWNASVPVGSRVMAWFSVGSPEFETRTTSPAWLAPSGAPLCEIDGKGGYHLDFLRVLPPGEPT